jgi:hypothetical protein
MIRSRADLTNSLASRESILGHPQPSGSTAVGGRLSSDNHRARCSAVALGPRQPHDAVPSWSRSLSVALVPSLVAALWPLVFSGVNGIKPAGWQPAPRGCVNRNQLISLAVAVRR